MNYYPAGVADPVCYLFLSNTIFLFMTRHKSLHYYMLLKWTYTIEEDTKDSIKLYIIRANELPGVCTDAENLETGMREIKKAMKAAFKLYKLHREEIPEPAPQK
jgi:predicted RNase H-like HicB family nuclease